MRNEFLSKLLKKIETNIKKFKKTNNDREIGMRKDEFYEFSIPDFSCLMNTKTGMAGHFLFLFNLTKEIKAKEVIEIGFGGANSALAFLLALRETGGRLTSIDISPKEEAINRIRKAGLQKYWNLVHSASRDARGQFPTSLKVDILFIDGNHSYNQCKLDHGMYKSLVREGGYIIFHDTTQYEGVIKFTHKLEKKELECIHFPYCNGIFVVRKR